MSNTISYLKKKRKASESWEGTSKYSSTDNPKEFNFLLPYLPIDLVLTQGVSRLHCEVG